MIKLQRRGRISSRAFSLIELMVVIGIIVLLIAVLIPVVKSSRDSAHRAATLSQMQGIARACEHYYADWNAYPGVVPDVGAAGSCIDGGTVKFSGAQNLFLGLTRRFYMAVPTTGTATAVPNLTPPTYFDDDPSRQMANYAVNNPFGALTIPGAPVTAAFNTFPPYMTARPSEISNVKHSNESNGLDLVKLPCFVDAAFGSDSKPILYYRQAYKYDPEMTPASVASAPFAGLGNITHDDPTDGTHACYYSNANTLIASDSTIPTTTSTPKLDTFVTNNINGQMVPKGGFVLISAGIDRVYGTSDDIVVTGGQ
jgi:type II secretory pathway pseudopilin PulG